MHPSNNRSLKKLMREHFNERTKLLSTIPEDSVISLDFKNSENGKKRGRWIVMLFFVATILGLACAIVAGIMYEIKESNPKHDKEEKSVWEPKGYKDYFIGTMEKAKIPGVVAATLKNGTVVWTGSIGYVDAVDKSELSKDNLFLISYLSQVWTSVAVLRLVEQGDLDLDKDVSEYLGINVTNPNFNGTAISLRHLLTHTSSICDRESVLWSMYFVECDIITLKDFILDVFAQDGKYSNDSLNFANWRPGTKFEYSSVGIALAGYIVERVVKQNFEDWYPEAILHKARLNATFWRYCQAQKAGFVVAKPHGYNLTGFLEGSWITKSKEEQQLLEDIISRIVDPYDSKNMSNDSYFRFRQYGLPHYPGGGMRTTVTDQARLLCMIMNDGEMQSCGGDSGNFISRESAQHLRELQGQTEGKSSLGFIELSTGGRELIGSEGFDFGVSSRMTIDLKNNNAVVILSNGHLNGDEYRITLRYIESFLYTAIEGAPPNLPSIL